MTNGKKRIKEQNITHHIQQNTHNSIRIYTHHTMIIQEKKYIYLFFKMIFQFVFLDDYRFNRYLIILTRDFEVLHQELLVKQDYMLK